MTTHHAARAPRTAAALVLLLACAAGLLASAGERAPGDADAFPPLAHRVDPNTADAATLDLLPRIGPTLSERIVSDREARGPFRSVEDLDRVRGIGPRTLIRLRPHLVIGPDPG